MLFRWFRKIREPAVDDIKELRQTTEDLKIVANDLRRTQSKMERTLNIINKDREIHA